MERLNRKSNRRGSALLIVLGMLSFMVISAVAFSAYMRFARLPSSFLRRSIASRLLVKAALARAIDEVDAAIGNNPHPNVGNKQYYYPLNIGTGDNQSILLNRNHWQYRVYMGGTNDVNMVPMIPQSSTVSPLCLEALAYIPPSIVNEVRYFSRHSLAAKWHDMDYDSGRYAFCAVDVSDYFDINAVHADVPRLSTDGSRISLAYLFESEDHDRSTPISGMCTPSDWDDFMSNFLPQGTTAAQAMKGGNKGANGGSTLPLTSIADFNLALYNLKAGSLQSPFCEFIQQNKQNFYGFSESSAQAEVVRRMTFVTDSWLEGIDEYDSNGSNSGSGSKGGNGGGNNKKSSSTEVVDLSIKENQPFLPNLLNSSKANLATIMGYSGTSLWGSHYKYLLSGIEGACLFDYLDKDSVPLSLAIPSCERIPMICAIEPRLEMTQLQVKPDQPQYSGNGVSDNITPVPTSAGLTRTVTKKVTYKFDGSAFKTFFTIPGGIKPLIVYPFRHKGESRSYDIDGQVALFLNKSGDTIGLRASSSSPLNMADKPTISSAEMRNGAVIAPLDKTSIGTFGDKEFENENDTGIFNDNVTVKGGDSSGANSLVGNLKLLEVTYEWQQTAVIDNPDSDPVTYKWDPQDPKPSDLTAATTDFPPLNSNGEKESQFDSTLLSLLKNGSGNAEYEFNAAIWLRIKDSKEGKYVDMVPACVEDDAVNGSSSNGKLTQGLGDAYPVMRFKLGASIKFSGDQAAHTGNTLVQVGTASGVASPECIAVGDPRFNNMPESWFNTGSSTMSSAQWLQACGCKDNNNGIKDGDIFMATSDRGYMQSIYEMCFIPRSSNALWNESGKKLVDDYQDTTFNEYKTSLKDTLNYHLMWRTFDPWLDADDFAEFCSGFCFGTGGYKISPYSDENILVAAFANTPIDWRYTADLDWLEENGGSLDDQISKKSDLDAVSFNKECVWNEYTSSQSSKLTWDDVTYVAECFHDAMANSTADDYWQDIFEGLAWRDNAKIIGGTQKDYLLNGMQLQSDSSRIYSADRKFLYGYWRDCFSARQQLFLIFVRAEPLMMGGGMAGAIPPSLGAKAVALVWRDPSPTSETSTGRPAPHRTRVLFYRQFD